MTDLADATLADMARRRLDRLARLSTEYEAQLNPRGVRLLRHAAFEAYITLRDLEETQADRARPAAAAQGADGALDG